jgi:Na+-transporting NADH:ubiquinone oxidoreductase subunit NqrF
MKILLILLTATLFISSCASNGSSSNRAKNLQVSKNAKDVLADKSSDERVICKQQRKTGSNRIVTICLSESEMKDVREKTQRDLRRRTGKGDPTNRK